METVRESAKPQKVQIHAKNSLLCGQTDLVDNDSWMDTFAEKTENIFIFSDMFINF